MTTLIGTATLNLPGNTQSISFGNPTTLDSITYGASGITYPTTSSFVLGASDFALFALYSQQFITALLINFPALYPFYKKAAPTCGYSLQVPQGATEFTYTQTTGNGLTPVYTLSTHRGNLNTTFAARTSPVTITYQEFLIGQPIIQQYAA
jgi:hypothetical protein